MGPGTENTAGGRDGPIERWSRTPGLGGAGQKTLQGRAPSKIKSELLGVVGRASVQKTLQGRAPSKSSPEHPLCILLVNIFKGLLP